jgi:hypothetical protein
MPIDHSGNGYLAADTDILVEAFKGALKKLVVDRTNPEALVVAKYMITFAQAGERDLARPRPYCRSCPDRARGIRAPASTRG